MEVENKVEVAGGVVDAAAQHYRNDNKRQRVRLGQV